MSFISATLLFLLVMDPPGNVPMFLTALRHTAAERRVKVILREVMIALAIMLTFLAAGRSMLAALHVSADALTAAGGVILLLIAIRMIFPSDEANLTEATHGEPFIVPLAVPYLAGPSLLATEILFISKEPQRWPVFLAALLTAWAVTAIVLLASGWLQRYLGDKAMTAMERLMGMALVMIGVQMLMDGIGRYYHLL